ncbi:hypothetical protein MBAG_03596 [Coprobacillus sp. D7]|nr:hypothetical protein MBAG_03596 [Coprobacillus sp. D7]
MLGFKKRDIKEALNAWLHDMEEYGSMPKYLLF